MARPLRLEYPGALYHITSRGNARQDIYLDDDDRSKFLNILSNEIRQQRWNCYPYCLMSNHYHLMIETPEGKLISGMRRLNGIYTQWFNRRHGRIGHLFQGRYKSIIVDRESYLLELCRYVVLNPVRAGLVKHPQEWKWSSYLATMGKINKSEWLDTEWILLQFGISNKKAQEEYKRFIEEGFGVPSPWDRLKGQIWLGSDAFLEKMDSLIRRDNLDEVPLSQTVPTRPTKFEIIETISKAYGITIKELVERNNPEAYQTSVYLLRRVVNMDLKAVARTFGVSTARISRIQSDIEKDLKGRKKLLKLLKRYKVKN
ncbi:MAG: transposase [Thermodesulfobacteriota bacterium]